MQHQQKKNRSPGVVKAANPTQKEGALPQPLTPMAKGKSNNQGPGKKLKALEGEKNELQRQLSAVSAELEERKMESGQDKQRLDSAMKELLLNQLHNVDQFHTKVAAMKSQATTGEAESQVGDMAARLTMIERSLSEIRTKFDERVKLFEDNENSSSKPSAVGGIDLLDPKELQQDMATVQRLIDLVACLEAQVQAYLGGSDDSSNGTTKLHEKIVVAEKERSAAEQKLAKFSARCEELVVSLAFEKKCLLREKENVYTSLREMILLQARHAKSIHERLDILKSDQVEQALSESGFDEMEVRIKLAETALQDLLNDHEAKKSLIDSEQERFKTELSDIAKSIPDASPVVHNAAGVVNPNEAASHGIDFSASFAKLYSVRKVLTFLDAQLRSAGAPNESVESQAAVQTLEAEKSTSRKALVEMHRLVLRGKKTYLEEKENTCVCMNAVIQVQKQEVDLLRTQIAAWKSSGTNNEGGDVDAAETRLKLVENALEEIALGHDQTKKQISVNRKLVQAEESNVPTAETLELTNSASIDAMSTADLKESCNKLLKLQQTITLLQTQIKDAGWDSVPQSVHRAEKQDAVEKLEGKQRYFLDEKANTFMGLVEFISVQQKEAQLVRSKVEKLQQHSSSSFGDSEARLTMLETALNSLHAECKTTIQKVEAARSISAGQVVDDDVLKPTDAKKSFVRVNQLRGILGFISAQVDAAMANQEADERQLAQPVAVFEESENTQLFQIRALLRSQREETRQLRGLVERNNSGFGAIAGFVFRVVFWFLVAGALYLVLTWDDSTTASVLNVACSPVAPGSRITNESGPLDAPFWVPKKFKKAVFHRVCRGLPQVRLEIKNNRIVVTDIEAEKVLTVHEAVHEGHSANEEEAPQKRKGLFKRSDAGDAKPENAKQQKPGHHASFAYLASDSLFMAHSGEILEVELPWAWGVDHDRTRYPRSHRSHHKITTH